MKWNMSISKTEEGNITFEHLSTSSQIKISNDRGSIIRLDYHELEYLMEIIERIKEDNMTLICEHPLDRILYRGKDKPSICSKCGMEFTADLFDETVLDDINISAFAFNTGKLIEDAINLKTGNLEQQNNHLQALIFQWWNKTNKDSKFAKHFGITTQRHGEII